MSLLGIDVGTTGCKAAVYSEEGSLLASAYEEYDHRRRQPGWAELDSEEVWERVKGVIARVATETRHDPIKALSVSSLGEATVPVTRDRRILGPSLLNFDVRGEEFLSRLRDALPNERLYELNGNVLGNHYSLTKLLWVREHESEIYARAFKFLLWGSFISFMLGGAPVVDYSLANRTLLFDINSRAWSSELLTAAGLDRDKLPDTAPSGTPIGEVSRAVSAELGLPPGTVIVTGAHDQCANGVGCGVVQEGRAMLGMGTYLCMMPIFTRRRDPTVMMERGLNTEHHAAPGQFVCFIYNQGGALVKWFRDTFAAAERRQAHASGADVYDLLIAEIPSGPSRAMVLPHFTATGPPHFISDSCGVIAGLHLDTTRGDILKSILEGTVFYLRECVDDLPPTGIAISDFRAVGGGSKSDRWLQVCADILGRPVTRTRTTEAGTLGAAILAGCGIGVFPSAQAGADSLVHLDHTFAPDPTTQCLYAERMRAYSQMWPAMKSLLRELS